MALPITEKEIAEKLSIPLRSPILCNSIDHIGFDLAAFKALINPYFETLPWDNYDVKRSQYDYLRQHNISFDFDEFKAYYLDNERPTNPELPEVQPWRRRGVATYEVELSKDQIDVRIKEATPFAQEVDTEDIRSLPRTFQQLPLELVAHEYLIRFIEYIALHTQEVTEYADLKHLELTLHFMGVVAREYQAGNNSPEGPHEDGADFIVSALVMDRENITGGESQIYEKKVDGSLVKVFGHVLQEGEFLYQADTGEEKHYGNDLWHFVTPFHLINSKQPGWRNIIGFDIKILSLEMTPDLS